MGTALGMLVFLLSGELLERYLFFTAVIPPKMPGGIAHEKGRREVAEHPLVKRVDSLIRQWDGELTQDLVLHPGEFGLGKCLPDSSRTTPQTWFAAFAQLVAASESISRMAKPSISAQRRITR